MPVFDYRFTVPASLEAVRDFHRDLVATTSAIHVRSDVERKRLFGMAPTDRPADAAATAALYSDTATRQTYERLASLAKTMLANGASVVIDAACTRRWQRDLLAHAATANGCALTWLAPDLPEHELIARVEARRISGHDASDASAAIVRQQLATFEPITPAELAAHPNTRLLDGRRPPQADRPSPTFSEGGARCH